MRVFSSSIDHQNFFPLAIEIRIAPLQVIPDLRRLEGLLIQNPPELGTLHLAYQRRSLSRKFRQHRSLIFRQHPGRPLRFPSHEHSCQESYENHRCCRLFCNYIGGTDY